MWPDNNKDECDYNSQVVDEEDERYQSFVIEESIFEDI